MCAYNQSLTIDDYQTKWNSIKNAIVFHLFETRYFFESISSIFSRQFPIPFQLFIYFFPLSSEIFKFIVHRNGEFEIDFIENPREMEDSREKMSRSRILNKIMYFISTKFFIVDYGRLHSSIKQKKKACLVLFSAENPFA